jgi:hypothetical protein
MKQAHQTILFFVFLLAFIPGILGQGRTIPVYSLARQQIDFPWAGGMNTCQFGKVDLDMDGIKDLVVFDRTGDRILPFRVIPSGNSFDYQYAPQFAANFPGISHWVIFADYDLDGQEDIFTYSPGYAGLKVYRNTSTTALEFRLEVFPFLESFQGGGYVNILVTYADYPAITDLDGDGDLDILTFWGLGSFVEKHVNMSMEKYGHADSLDFIKTEFCWGYFAESEESNQITLDTCLRCDKENYLELSEFPTNDQRLTTDDYRHTGSTFCILDLNGDNLPDLLLGDVDFPNLVALYNGGNADTARMTSYDWQYPPGDKAVDLFSMPGAFYDDFDFDGVKDLLVSPFDPNPFNPENFTSNWFYHNDLANDQPSFSLHTRSFLQDRMLDFGAGAYPVFFDVDNDGLKDLVIGNYGYYDSSYYDGSLILHSVHTGKLAILLNTGTSALPAFTFTERDFAGISALNLIGVMPAFGDLDGDGDADMLLGSENGQVIYFENIAVSGEPAVFSLSQSNYQGIDVGSFSTPQLFDLDRDNLPDLIIGEKAGNLNYYRNTGSLQNPVFTLATDSLGKINVTDYNVSLDGYSVPHFYRDADDITHLLVGSEQGEVFYYTGIDGNLTGEFILSDALDDLLGLQEVKTDMGYRSAPALSDLDNDGIPELIAGNFSGGLEYFGLHDGTPVNNIQNGDPEEKVEILVYPNPSKDQFKVIIPGLTNKDFVTLNLYNFQGQSVMSYSGNYRDPLSINTEFLPAGIYFLNINQNNRHPAENLVFIKVP